MAKKRLGDVLLALKAKTPGAMPSLNPEAIEQAVATQAQEGGLLGEILVKMRAIAEEDLLQALGLQLGIPYSADLKVADVDIDLATSVPIGFAKQHRLLVVKREGDTAMVATGDPLEIGAFDDLRMQLSLELQPILVPPQRILEVINDVYGRKADKGGDLDKKEDEEDEGTSEELVDILEITDEAPIIRWVNSLLFNAVKERASDIHIEPGEKEVLVRYRIDGELYETRRAARQFMPSIISRVKIMAGLNIAEKRLPQDGRIRRKIAGKDIDMRVATAPTVKQGERITIRLLDRESVLHDLADIGFGDDHLRQMDDLIHRPHGILLVTGPTGSGKTTTLYACLAKINSPELNILTIEDPVEYQLDGISQTAVNEKFDLTFAAGLRSFLRHDPDVIMVGEIRDRETADMAIQAALTGHLVLSTLHTNDAPTSITRLLDLGAPAYLLSSTLLGIMAQRLVRTLCKNCKEKVPFARDEEIRTWDSVCSPFKAEPPSHVYRPVGCLECRNTGYLGRVGIYEILSMTRDVKRLITAQTDIAVLTQAAFKGGMRPLRVSGAIKVAQGITTLEEVLKVAPLA